MDDWHPSCAPGCEQPWIRFDGAAQPRHIVAKHFAETAGLKEVALHVDDQQCAVRRRKIVSIRLRPDAHGFRSYSLLPRMVEAAVVPRRLVNFQPATAHR